MKRCVSLVLLAAALLGACAGSQPVSRSFECMDTFMKIEIYDDGGSAEKIQAELERLGTQLSASGQGEIARVNRDGSAVVSAETAALTEAALEQCADSGGALDITVYPLVEEWGFISRDYRIPDQKTIDALLEKTDYRAVRAESEGEMKTVSVPGGAKLDLGAVAKGFAADRAVEIMRESGAKSGILNLGGTVAAVGKKPGGQDWRVGITDPENTASYFGSVACHDRIVATSGNYERYFEKDGRRYCHIIDPATGYPADNGTVSVTVISDSGLRSDALSTALFVMGRDKAAEYWQENRDFDFVILDDEDNLLLTPGAADCFELRDGFDYKIDII